MRPNPKSPALNETLASTTSATLIPAIPSMLTFHAISTVSSAREPRISAKPFCDVAPVTLRRGLSDLQETRRDPKDQRRREEEGDRLIPYAQSGLVAATRTPPASGPSTVVIASDAWSRPCALRQLRVLDEVRQPRVDRRPEETGRKPGDRSQHDDLGRALRKRERAEDEEADEVRRTTITRRRERRSMSGPIVRPSTIAGRKSAISSALTQVPEPVRSQTSIVSATNASQVPRPEPKAAKKSRRSPRTRRSRSTCVPRSGARLR